MSNNQNEEILKMLLKPIIEAFKEKFSELTIPQVKSIPLILKGENLLLLAPAGTGKTEAALLPIFNEMLLLRNIPGIKLIYITPLRALNRDLLERIDWWCRKLDFTVSVRHGDTAQKERRIQAISPPDILILTPETLQAVLTGKVLREHLKNVRWVVIDEIHELATDKRGTQLSIALERLVEITGKNFQRIGLSATIGNPEKIAKFLVGMNNKCEIVKVSIAKEMKIDVLYPYPRKEDKILAEKLLTLPSVAARLSLIRKLIESHESTLIFTNTRPLAEILTNRFKVWDLDFPIGIHHGSLAKVSRVSAEQGLKYGKLIGIVCTSSLELGIDIGKIDLCIQYNSPREVTRLMQRVGRSGHSIGRFSKGIIIVMDGDDALEAVVISNRALNEELEDPIIPEDCSDVLMNQIAGILIEYSKYNIDNLLEIFRRTYPFRNLSKEHLMKVINHMVSLGIAYSDGKTISKPINAKQLYKYYFDTLSMIPEIKQYLVINELNNEPIGILDEEFVSEYGDVNTKFVLASRAWRIIDASGEKIHVLPEEDFEGAIPFWVGEEIPVPREVAQEVGKIRREVEERLLNGERYKDICLDISKRYNINFKTIFRGLKEVLKHVKLNIPVPTDETIVLEKFKENIVLHIHGGLRINRAISRLIAYYLSEKISTPIASQQDPYRIVFRSPNIEPEDILNIIKEISMKNISEIIVPAIVSSGFFRKRVVHIARKMGVILKEASLLDIPISKIVKAVKDTPIYEEALRNVANYDMDINGASEFLKDITTKKFEVKIVKLDSPSPLALLTLNKYKKEFEFSTSERMQGLILKAVKARLLSETPLLICSNCWKYYERKSLKDIEDIINCPNCDSKKIACLNNIEIEELYGLISRKGKPINSNEKRLIKKIKKISLLIEKYGKAAAIALCGKNLEIKDVIEILEKENKFNDKLIELIIEAEKKTLKRMFK
ncbi:MAG: DEAD/DEAH box helicase [Nitrososphaerota archaeon]